MYFSQIALITLSIFLSVRKCGEKTSGFYSIYSTSTFAKNVAHHRLRSSAMEELTMTKVWMIHLKR